MKYWGRIQIVARRQKSESSRKKKKISEEFKTISKPQSTSVIPPDFYYSGF
jgi:hypothetical protein